MDKKSKIIIVSNKSLISISLLGKLRRKGFRNLILTDSAGVRLVEQKPVADFFRKEKPDYCFLLSIKEGGIGENISYPADLIYQNLIVQSNVIHSAWKFNVKKMVFFASSCVYPKDCPQPMKEECLLTGPLEPTNEPYAISKIAGIKMCQAYNRQYGTHFISAIPATVFGPNDNFDLSTSHVISALMRKFHEAKIKNSHDVVIWGSGRPQREFIYVDDLTDAVLFLMQQNNSIELINIGTGVDISIRRLASLIKKIVGFKGRLIFDRNKPDGASRKLLDSSQLNSLGWKAKTDLLSSLEYTYRWYRSQGGFRIKRIR